MSICLQFDILGTSKIIGVGTAGNIFIILNSLICNNKLVYVDMYTKGKSINYDSQYSKDYNIINPFEYYFKQVAEFNTNIVNIKDDIHILKYTSENDIDSTIHKKVRELFYNNFTLKPELQLELDKFCYDNNINDKITLGINIRLTDMIHYHNTPNIQYFIEKIKKCKETFYFDQCFIATDNNECIDILLDVFKDIRFVFQKDIARENKINSKSYPHERYDTTRLYDSYLRGKEVLFDIFILSKCKYLIKSHSAVSDASIILKENISYIL